MVTNSKHLLMELSGCEKSLLNNKKYVRNLAKEAVIRSGCTILKIVVHQFSPFGVSCVIVIAESHLSIHTWPEHGYVASDFHTCGNCDETILLDILEQGFKARSCESMLVERGDIKGMSYFKSPQIKYRGLNDLKGINITQLQG